MSTANNSRIPRRRSKYSVDPRSCLRACANSVSQLTLTRRQEVQALEEEGEDGMVHSLLTVLPDLYEEGDDPPGPLVEEKPSLPQDSPADLLPKTETFEHLEPAAEMNVSPATLPVPEGLDHEDLDGSTDVSMDPLEEGIYRERESSIDASTDGGSETLVDADELAQTTGGINTPVIPSSPEPKAIVEPSEVPHLSSEDQGEKVPLLAPGESDEHAPLPSRTRNPRQRQRGRPRPRRARRRSAAGRSSPRRGRTPSPAHRRARSAGRPAGGPWRRR